MDHGDILRTSAQVITKRRETYGSPAQCFERAAVIAGAMLDKPVTPYELAVIFHAMKLARIAQSPKNVDHYVDGVSYLSFAAEFADAEPESPQRDTKAVSGRSVEKILGGASDARAAPGPHADRVAP